MCEADLPLLGSLTCFQVLLGHQQVLLTLEDMAVYLTQEEWRCLDLARQGHGCGVLPEDEGNVRRDPGFVHQTLCCVSDLELWTQFEDGRDHREDALMTTGWGQALPNPGQRRGLATIRPQ